MSFENTSCPCGEVKVAGTLVCGSCERHVRDQGGEFDVANWQNVKFNTDQRRAMAVRVLSAARKRRRVCSLWSE